MNLYKRVDDFKVLIDVIRPFEGEIFKQINAYYRIGLTWTSNEYLTYSRRVFTRCDPPYSKGRLFSRYL